MIAVIQSEMRWFSEHFIVVCTLSPSNLEYCGHVWNNNWSGPFRKITLATKYSQIALNGKFRSCPVKLSEKYTTSSFGPTLWLIKKKLLYGNFTASSFGICFVPDITNNGFKYHIITCEIVSGQLSRVVGIRNIHLRSDKKDSS